MPADFDCSLPDQDPTSVSPLQLVMDAVDPALTIALRGLGSPARVSIDLVLADDPDTRQAGADLELTLSEGTDRGQIVMHLAPRSAGRRTYPMHVYRHPWFRAIA